LKHLGRYSHVVCARRLLGQTAPILKGGLICKRRQQRPRRTDELRPRLSFARFVAGEDAERRPWSVWFYGGGDPFVAEPTSPETRVLESGVSETIVSDREASEKGTSAVGGTFDCVKAMELCKTRKMLCDMRQGVYNKWPNPYYVHFDKEGNLLGAPKFGSKTDEYETGEYETNEHETDKTSDNYLSTWENRDEQSKIEGDTSPEETKSKQRRCPTSDQQEEMDRKRREKIATKRDDAEVPEYLWAEHLISDFKWKNRTVQLACGVMPKWRPSPWL